MKPPPALMIAALAVCCLCFFAHQCRSEPPPDQPPDRQAVQALIRQLSAAQFKTRKDAEEQLWRMGPQIEPQLVEALPSVDFEAKQRIRSIRRNFEFGITPEIPPKIRQQMILALEGKDVSVEAAKILTATGHFRPVLAILQRVQRDRSFYKFITAIRSESSKVPPSEQLDQFYVDLLRLALKHPDQGQARNMIRMIVGASHIQTRLSSIDGMEKLLELISECKADSERRRLVGDLRFSSSALTPEVVDKGLLAKWINLLAVDSDRRIRKQQISKLFSTSTLLSTSGGHQLNLGKLYDQLSPAGQNVLIDLLSEKTTVLQRLHERIGDEKILQGCRQTTDATTRGNLVGRVASLNSWPQQKDKPYGFLELLEPETDATARQQMVLGLLQGLSRKTPSTITPVAKEITDPIWEMLTRDDPQPWHLPALLETYQCEEAFGSYHNAETLKRLFSLASIAETVDAQSFAYAPANNEYLCQQLGKHGLSMEFLQTIVALSADYNMQSRLGLLLGSSRFTDSINNAKQRKSLLDFCRQKFAGRAKSLISSGIARNASLLSKLLQENDYATVKDALLDKLPETARADILGRLLTSEATIHYLAKSNQVDQLLKFDPALNAAQQIAILRFVAGSDAAVTAIIENEQFDELLKVIDDVKDESQRRILYQQMVTRKAYVKRLAKKKLLAITLADLQFNEEWLRMRGYERFIAGLDSADVEAEPTLAADFWKFALRLKTEYERRNCVQALIQSSWFFPQIYQQGQLNLVTGSIEKAVGQDRLRGMMQSWTRSAGAIYFLTPDRIDFIFDLCDILPEPDRRTSIEYLSRSNDVQEWFAGEGQPDKLIEIIDAIKDADRRELFVDSFLTYSLLYKQKDNQQLAAKLIELAKRQRQGLAARIALTLALMYRNAGQDLDEQLKLKLAELVVQQLNHGRPDAQTLQRIVGSSAIVQIIVERKLGGKIVQQALALDDPDQRLETLGLICSNYYLRNAISDQDFKNWFEGHVAVTRLASKSTSIWPPIATNLDRLIRLGYFDKIKQIVDAFPANRNSYQPPRLDFYCYPDVVKRMRADDQNADVIDQLLQEAENDQLYNRISRLFNNWPALHWLIETRGWDRFQSHLQRLRSQERLRIYGMLVANPALVRYLVENDQVDGILKKDELRNWLAEDDNRYLQFIHLVAQTNRFPKIIRDMIEDEDDKDRRAQVYFRLRAEPGTTLLNHPQRDWLIDTIEKLSADVLSDPGSRYYSARRHELRRISLEAGRLDVAERIVLADHRDDRDKLGIARFLLQRGKLNEFLDQLAKAPEPTTAAQKNDRDRLRFYLLRAAGRFAEAATLARQMEDALAWSLAIERHDWEAARDMPVPKSKEMPFPLTSNDINPIHRKIEQFGFRIALNQLTGRDQVAAESTGQLIELIESNIVDASNIAELNTARYGADALLTTGKPDEAFALLQKHYPRRVFYWHWDRLQFDQALESIGWSAEKADQCFDNYSFGNNGTHVQRTYGVNYMLQIASMLRQVQRTEDLAALLNALQNHPQRKKIDEQQRSEYFMTLATRLYQEGFGESSRLAIAAISDQQTPPDEYLSKIYSARSDRLGAAEASIWWSEFADRYPDDTPVERLARVDGVMTAKTPIEELLPLPRSQRTPDGPQIVRVPITCFRYGMDDEARKIFDSGTLSNWDHAVASGRIFYQQQNYQAAAESFLRAWELRTRDLSRLYMSGHCWEQAGQPQKGRQYKLMASLLPTSANTLHGLAIGLREEGLIEDAVQLDRVVMRTAAPGSLTYLTALNSVCEQTDDPQVALQLWHEHCLYHLRPILYRGSVPNWLRSITRHHVLRARAAIDQGDYEKAEAAWQDAKKISPGYMWVAHQIVPELRDRGQHELAERIFRAHEAYLVSKIEEYPQSGLLKERLNTLRKLCAPEPVAAN